MATKVDLTPPTDKPTGLSIKRDNKKFTFEWKIADADHGAGQKLDYKIYYDKTSTGDKISLNKTQTSTSHSIKSSSYYPNTSKNLKKIWFEIKGRRKQYTKGSGSKEKDIYS